jgi:predicted enzyme related to lactoylglutathione lyase
MKPIIQIAIDCEDPHALVQFWAAATGMDVEDHHDLVEEVIAAGYATDEHAVTLPSGRRAWAEAAACRDPDGNLPRLLFQVVPEPKTVKDRIHPDLHVGEEQRNTEVERLKSLGATFLWEASQGPQSWVTLADPEGNEFCVA